MPETHDDFGQLDLAYAKGRDTNRALKYRLGRRTLEVANSIKEFGPNPPTSIVDLGCAEGKMLIRLKDEFPDAKLTGIEGSSELVSLARSLCPDIEYKEANLDQMEFGNDCYDVAVMTAVIEHVSDPKKLFANIYKYLNPDGLLVVTAPDPFWENIATKVGHLRDEQHHEVMNLQQLSSLGSEAGFTTLKSEKFMLSPIGMPLEMPIEKLFRSLGLNFFFANQLLVFKK